MWYRERYRCRRIKIADKAKGQAAACPFVIDNGKLTVDNYDIALRYILIVGLADILIFNFQLSIVRGQRNGSPVSSEKNN